MKHFSFIKDSQNLIQLTKNKRFDSNLKQYSADFESLYTNIPLDKALDVIMQMVSVYKFNEISSYAIFEMLKLVLHNNYFSFEHNNLSTFLLQTKGIAMGTSYGQSVANLYLAYFELKYKILLNNLLYYRFIDDILYKDSSNTLTNKFNEIFPELTLNCITSKKVQFLDLNISFNIDRTLNFDLYVKPTFTGSYLNINSNHPKHIYKGIIISLISRIRRNCTDINNYYSHTSNLLFYLLPYLSNCNINNKSLNNLWFKSKTDKNNNNFLKILYKTTPNLNSYLVSKLKIPFREEFFSKCKNHLCKICKYAITDKFLLNFKNKEINIPSSTTCSSCNIIHSIHCLKCEKSYIGQSSRSAIARISEHISKIIKYKKINCIENEKYNDSEILYNHFKPYDHNLKEHFRFQIICKYIFNYRLRLETLLMFIFNKISPYGNKQSKDFNNNFETYKFGYELIQFTRLF